MGRTRESANLVSDKNIFVDIANDLVGIGTTAPTVELEVAGNAKVSGIVTATTFSGNLSGGTLSATTGAFSGNVTLQANLDMQDNDKILLGTGDDLEIYHNGTNSYIDNTTGDLYLRGNIGGDVGGDIYLQSKSGENNIVCYDDSAVELYFDNSKKFETTSAGVTITGTATATTFSGSGASLTNVDADTVDGIEASSFIRSDANDSTSGLYSFVAGAYSTNVTVGGRDIQTNLDIQSTSMRGGVLVRNMNNFRSETDSASFMHYDPYTTTATSYAFRAARGSTLADTFYVKSNGDGFFGGTVAATSYTGDGSALTGVGGEFDITSSLFS